MGSSAKHTKDTDANIGTFWRDTNYRKNSFKYISKKDHARQKPYNKTVTIKTFLEDSNTSPQLPKVTPFSEAHAKRYTWGEKNSLSGKVNFDSGHAPYSNEAHHLIPVSTFPEYTAEQQKLLRKIPYDINHGENIIYLPKVASRCAVHNLPQHSGDHPKYTRMVKKDVDDIKNKLEEVLDKIVPCDEWDPPNEIVDELITIQQDYWDLLVNKGAVNINTISRKR